MKNIAVLILAAGKSSRMNSTKQLLKVGKVTLLDKIIETAIKSKSNDVFCVLGANAEKIKKEVSIKDIQFIYNKNHENGLSSSIATGINCIEKKYPNIDAVLITLADQPNVNSDYLNQLINTYFKNPEKIIASKYNDTLGVPAVFPKKYYSNLQLLKGDKGAKEFLNSMKENVVPIISNNLFDIDTIEDYKKYLKSI